MEEDKIVLIMVVIFERGVDSFLNVVLVIREKYFGYILGY